MLAILGAVACDWETMEVAEQVEVPVSNATTVTVRAGKAGTRTSISEQNGKYVVGWKVGDKLAVIEGVPTIAWMVMNNPDYNGTAAMLYGTEGLDADTDNAEFTLELDERDDVSGRLILQVPPSMFLTHGIMRITEYTRQLIFLNHRTPLPTVLIQMLMSLSPRWSLAKILGRDNSLLNSPEWGLLSKWS